MDNIKTGYSFKNTFGTGLAICLALTGFNGTAAQIDVPGDYSTIQAAVDAATSGDQINVGEGAYAENVVIYKPLTLIGSQARVDAYGQDPAFTVTADNVRISNFDVRAYSGYSISASEVGGLVVDSCQLHYGDVTLAFSKGATITNCYVGGANYGIQSMGNGYMGGTNDVITHNEIWTSYVGIDVTYATVPVLLRSNLVSNCSYGINVGDSTSVSLIGNHVRATVYDWQEPLRFWSEFADTEVVLSGNNVHAVGTAGSINVTSINLLNYGANTLEVSGHFNRFGGATAVNLDGSGTTIANLTNNWWGKNSAPTSDVSVSPWLIMSVSPASVTTTNPVTISCNWYTNSASQNVSSLGLLPDSTDGLYTADASGYLVDPLLDNRVPMQITNGVSSVLYYPSANPGTVNCNLDYENVSALINH